MNNITDKTFVVMLKGGYKCYINEKQAEAIKNALINNIPFIKVDNLFFKSEDISFILPASEIDREEKIRQGFWQCSGNHWHGKNEECGHNVMAMAENDTKDFKSGWAKVSSN